jgi:hypothetical protein
MEERSSACVSGCSLTAAVTSEDTRLDRMWEVTEARIVVLSADYV